MPRYTYECSSGHVYEKVEGFDAPVKQRCPECRRTARRVPVSPAIVFRGSGFYKTDSRKAPDEAGAGDAKQGDAKQGRKAASPPSAGDSAKSGDGTGAGAAGSSPASDSATTSTRSD